MGILVRKRGVGAGVEIVIARLRGQAMSKINPLKAELIPLEKKLRNMETIKARVIVLKNQIRRIEVETERKIRLVQQRGAALEERKALRKSARL